MLCMIPVQTKDKCAYEAPLVRPPMIWQEKTSIRDGLVTVLSSTVNGLTQAHCKGVSAH